MNKFKIVVPSYNNSDWVIYNLASILNQTYTNWEVLYIDDASSDDTYNKVIEITKGDNRFKVVKRDKNMGAAFNYFISDDVVNFLDNPNDIVVHLDGDDWLYDDDVLQNLSNYYDKHDVWMTYGKFVCYDGTTNILLGYPQSTEYPEYVHDNKLYRKDIWRASHLRTYRTFLFNALDKSDLYSKIDGKLFWHALDLVFQYAYMEMCSKEKIGVVTFLTCVYNQAPKNSERTQVRESSNNNMFEEEARNKKTYATGLSGIKLPQINVFGDYLERHNIPKKFTYCYERSNGDFDITLLQDDKIYEYCTTGIKLKKWDTPMVARVCENRKFFNQQAVVNQLKQHHSAFDLILTWDKELLELPNAVFCPLTDVSQFNTLPASYYEFDPEFNEDKLNKTKLVSLVSSNKTMFPGHTTRLQFVDGIKDKVDVFGRGIKEIYSKLEALTDYKFSIAIENDIETNYFTEKLTDCFRTYTIPIYYGCPNISDFFDMDGIITFTTLEELKEIVNNLSTEKYYSKVDAIKNNFIKSKLYPLDNDSMFDLYYKNLLNK